VLDGFRLTHLTDFHRGRVTPDDLLAGAVNVAAALRPDAVMLTGDFVDRDHRDATPLARLLRPLTQAAPFGVWGCLGNHDYGTDANRVAAALEGEGGVRVLRNDAAPLAPGLWVAGIDDTWRGRADPAAALRRVPGDAATVFLTHNPVGVFGCDRRTCVALAGHTHGGQVCVPGLPPRRPGGMDGFPYVEGWGVFDRARLYINRGVGMSGLPLRLCCRPEIAVFTLRRGDGPPRGPRSLTVRAYDKAVRALKKSGPAFR
jgi:hypothetical protein